MHLSELLQVQDIGERNQLLRKTLAAYTDVVDVTGCELQLLIIAINLTLPKKDVDDLLDRALARLLLKNQEHLQHCVDEVQWFHSHNVKYPDSRVKEQRIIAQVKKPVDGVLSSPNLPQAFGWSHNSSQVNPAKFFAVRFNWQNRETSLLEVVLDNVAEWQAVFSTLGMTRKQLSDVRATLSDHHASNQLPSEVSDYSKQIRVPYLGDYYALTPVISHSVQAQIQKMAFNRKVRTANIEHSHPANVGSLVASLGGNIRVLNYQPNVTQKTSESFAEYRYGSTKSVFDHSVIKDKRFLQALSRIAGERSAPMLRQRRQLRVSALRFVRKQLALWLAPMMEWRDSIEANALHSRPIETLEEQLLYLPIDNLPDALSDLNAHFHQALQYHRLGGRYAFHPEIIHPIKQQLKWLLNYIANQEDPAVECQSNCVFLHLQQLKVHDASLLSNPYVSGIPSLTALGGLMHNYQRKLCALLGSECSIKRGAWFIAQYHRQAGKKLPEPDKVRYRKKASNVQHPGIVDGVYGDLTMDLVLELQLPESASIPDLMLLQAAFPSRFAGGTLHPPSLFELTNWLSVYPTQSELFSVLSRLPRSGCWIYPDDKGANSFEELAVRLDSELDLKPIGLGFLPLEKPQVRAGSVAPFHCYAEPCIGVIRCMNPINVRLSGSKQFYQSAFWHFDIANNAMLMKKAI
ncbi:type I-F CRISPR-associated protein Csy2 [Photobacterium chitinilyticum]|nr:type I-F CRISPR-associated protein Csy2 [Photobacterium chitinilyticum]